MHAQMQVREQREFEREDARCREDDRRGDGEGRY
jgi:hypothetical protein